MHDILKYQASRQEQKGAHLLSANTWRSNYYWPVWIGEQKHD